ncbi:MAG: flagellar motor protein MotB [Synergistaceae bacterium]|jgi:chemotaxis protein MotB|nr:flagellar motor protein MotB [Synergistaceae bacterium]
MAHKKKEQQASVGAPLYMATYGDMVTLVLCFFVLLFAMSSVDAEKFKKALISLKGSLGVLRGGTATESPLEPNPPIEAVTTDQISPGTSPQRVLDTQHVAYTIESYLRKENLEKSIQVTVNQRGVTVSISDQFLFDSGSAVLKNDGKRVLYKIAALVRNVVPAVAIEGHTDGVPLNGGIYRDNWGLSSARAGVVASYMESEGAFAPEKLQAVGYSSYRPVVPNDTPEHRALNRRVDLVFLSQYPK